MCYYVISQFITIDFPAWITAIATLLIAIITFAYTIYSRKLWTSTRETLGFNQKSFELLNSPSLGIAEFRKYPGNANGIVIIETNIKNYGNLPAKKFTVKIDISSEKERTLHSLIEKLLPVDANLSTPKKTLSPNANSIIYSNNIFPDKRIFLTIELSYQGIDGSIKTEKYLYRNDPDSDDFFLLD